MTDATEYLDEIDALLGPSISPSLTSASSTSDIFEAYVFSLIIQAAQTEGARIQYRDVFGGIPSTFVFRTSPGFIFSTIRPYTHAEIEFDDKPILEAHVGVRVVGLSRVLHECDVAVIEQIEAETCRRNQVPPRSRKVPIAVECKFYTTALQLHLARAFLGLTEDLSSKNTGFFVSNTESDSVEKLLTNRGREWEHNLIPRSVVNVERMRNRFQSVFQRYKAS